MNIAIVSVFNVSVLEDYVYPEYRESLRQLDSNFAPAVETLTLELLRKGEYIIVFTQDIKAKKVEAFYGEKVSIYVAPKNPKIINILTLGFYTPFAIKKLFRLHKGPIDVVSAHWTRDYAMAAEKFINKVPVFVTVRDILPKIMSQVKSDRFRWRMIWLKNEYVLRKKGYRYIANSDYTAYEVKRHWKHEIPVIPNSIPVFHHDPDLKDDPMKSPGKISITTISLGDFTNKWKNIPTLLKAFSIFRQSYPDAVLNLVGPYFIEENPLVEGYRKEGLMEGVNLSGKRSPKEVIDILMKSSMMVHPSYEETFGNTLIEALSCGIPVVGGENSGAVPWVLGHGKFGYLCNIDDPHDIADTMLHIVEHYDEAKEKGLMGQKECATTYNVSNVADKYLSLFKAGKLH